MLSAAPYLSDVVSIGRTQVNATRGTHLMIPRTSVLVPATVSAELSSARIQYVPLPAVWLVVRRTE